MERTVLSSHFEFDEEAMGRFADAMRVAAAGSEDVLDYLSGECFGQLWDECVKITEGRASVRRWGKVRDRVLH